MPLMVLPIYLVSEKGQKRMLSRPNFRFTETRLLTETSRKFSLCILQYRSKVSWESQLETRIPILDDIETRVSRYCQITFVRHCTCLWDRQNQRRQRARYFKSSLFISLITSPIVSSFNHKLLNQVVLSIYRHCSGRNWPWVIWKTNKGKYYRWMEILKANLHCACRQLWRKAIYNWHWNFTLAGAMLISFLKSFPFSLETRLICWYVVGKWTPVNISLFSGITLRSPVQFSSR